MQSNIQNLAPHRMYTKRETQHAQEYQNSVPPRSGKPIKYRGCSVKLTIHEGGWGRCLILSKPVNPPLFPFRSDPRYLKTLFGIVPLQRKVDVSFQGLFLRQLSQHTDEDRGQKLFELHQKHDESEIRAKILIYIICAPLYFRNPRICSCITKTKTCALFKAKSVDPRTYSATPPPPPPTSDLFSAFIIYAKNNGYKIFNASMP